MTELKYKGNINHKWQTKSYPRTPSSFNNFGAPSRKVLAQPGLVCIRTLTASIGAKAISAKNSALAEAAKYSDVLQVYVYS